MGFACGRYYGISCGRCGLWPISSVVDMVVADMVCGRYRRNSVNITLWEASCVTQKAVKFTPDRIVWVELMECIVRNLHDVYMTNRKRLEWVDRSTETCQDGFLYRRVPCRSTPQPNSYTGKIMSAADIHNYIYKAGAKPLSSLIYSFPLSLPQSLGRNLSLNMRVKTAL